MAKYLSDEMRSELIVFLKERSKFSETVIARFCSLEVRQIIHDMTIVDECKWHDLRENPDDIPKDDSKFLLCYIGINGEDMYMTWWRKGKDIFPLYIEPVAWCYINKFEVGQK